MGTAKRSRVQRVQRVLPAPGRRVQRVVVSPSAMSIKSELRDFPPGTVILSLRRRISVHAAFETIGDKYRSAGRHGQAFGREGVRLRRRLCRKVVEKGCVERFLGLTGPMGRRVLRFDGPFGPRVVVSPMGPLCGPGSKGSEGSEGHGSAVGCGRLRRRVV